MHNRQNALNNWLEKVLAPSKFTLHPLAGDASFRRYFRLHHNSMTQVVMDAPPDKEALQPFLTVAGLLTTAGVRTPQIHVVDKEQGFALLDDFGDALLLNHLNVETANKLYPMAMNTLIKMQQCSTQATAQLPIFDRPFIMYELNVFREWFLDAYLKIKLTAAEEKLLDETFAQLCDTILEQPQCFIHRDYHSRNIMLLAEHEDHALGIIDFQDAMRGPFTYDLVSLLKDCYIQWPREQVMKWLTTFHSQAPSATGWSLSAFTRAFDWCGLQRHLKVLGVFSRLYLRDNKANYLQDLPLTHHYVMACLETYEELHPFYQFMQNRIRLP